MRQHTASILTSSLLIVFLSLSVEQAAAMSRHHHHDGGGSQSGVGENVKTSSTFHSIDAQAYVTPVPEPSTVVLLGSGVAALGLWRWKKKQ